MKSLDQYHLAKCMRGHLDVFVKLGTLPNKAEPMKCFLTIPPCDFGKAARSALSDEGCVIVEGSWLRLTEKGYRRAHHLE